MRLIIAILFILLGTLRLSAQAPRIERLPGGLKVAEMPVLAIVPSQSGFLWFGSWFGLFRYDGYTLKEYMPAAQWDGKPVTAYKISCLYEDKNGILWIGLYSGGLFRFDPVTQQSTVWQSRQNDPVTLSDNTVQCIAEDPFGYIWVGTKNGLNRLDPQSGKIQRYFAQNGLQNHQIRSLCMGRDGVLWVGSYNGIARAQIAAEGAAAFQHFFLTPPAENAPPGVESPHDFIFTIREDNHADGLIWIGTKGGLKRLDMRQPSFSNALTHYRARPGGLSDNFVEAILETTEGPNQILWIGTYNGLNRLEVATETFTTYLPAKADPFSLNDNMVISLAADRAGLVWVGTHKGINKINPLPKPFRSLGFGSSAENNLWALTGSAANGTEIWAGSAGGGLKHIVVSGHEPVVRSVSLAQLTGAPQANFIYDLHLDAEGWLWVATRGAGIIRYRTTGPSAWERFSTGSHRLSDNFVMCVHEDRNGRLWFGAWEGGLMCFDRKSGQFRVFKDLPNDNMRLTDFPLVELHSAAAGTGNAAMDLWIGTRGGGLLQLEVDSTGTSLRLKNAFTSAAKGRNHINNDNITAIRRGPDRQLWITTEEGLNHWDTITQTFVSWSLQDGLPDRVVQTVCFDNAGKAWITTGNGIAQLTFDERYRLLKMRSFDKSDGLPSNFFHDGSGWMSPEGWLFLGSYEGLCYFPATQIKENQHVSDVVFSGLKIFNRPVAVGGNAGVLKKDINFVGQIILPYSDNVFSIQFAALDFQEPKKNRYAYRLLGFHDQWVNVDAENREAHFTNLSEGKYTLEVIAANHDGVWSETPKRLTICIEPPFYRTIWAYLFYALAIAGFIYWFRRMELARVELNNRVKMETLRREKTEEVERMKVRFFTHISHELKTPLTLILSPLEDLIKGNLAQSETREVYEVMQRNANRLNHLISQILILRKTEEGLMKLSVGACDLVEFLKDICIAFRELAHSHHVDFRFIATEESLQVWFDREQLEKVFYNLLSNAFKFTPSGGHITVKLDTADQQVRVVVEDDGKGIAEAELPRVFDLFYTGKPDAALKKSAGTGIGLALSKSIVDLHGGAIRAESAGEGTGSRFTVLLPLGNTHFDPDNLEPAAQVGAQPLPGKLPVPLETANGRENGVPEKENPLILVVDDHEDIRTYIRVRLQANYQVEEAGGGREAWEKTHQLVPDLVISDILMPEWDGLQLCRQIKNDPLTSHIPVILLTAKGSTSTQIDGLDAGADDYIAKPFDPELLLARVRNLLLAQERLQKHFRHGAPMPLKELDISHLDQQFLQKCIDCIERHLADPDYSVEQLGKTLFISRMQLYRKIKALTGDSPNHFIRAIRLSRAAQLLEKGYSVAEVTYQVGFQDLKYFRESFRKQFGVNPSEYGLKRSTR